MARFTRFACAVVAFIAIVVAVAVPAAEAAIPRACSTPTTDKFPFCDTSLSVDDRVANLISLLTNEEKPPLLTARESPKGGVPRIGLPEYDWGANCVHGVQSRCGTRCATSFACPNGLGASWNMTNVHHMAQIIGWELRALWLEGVGEDHANDLPHVGLDCWSPNINIPRDPRWGRSQEVPSECPVLNGLYGAAYTEGLQNGPDPRYLQAVVTLKHWDAYSLESYGGVTRETFNAVCSPYDLTSTYYPAFKHAVMEGKAKGVMCSYNEVNGIPSCANDFMNYTLRGKWGFDGYVTSDSGAVDFIESTHHYVKTLPEAAGLAMKAGTDINSGGVYLNNIASAVEQGLMTWDDVDLALTRTLKLRFLLGLFDPIENQPYWHVPPDAVNTPESQAFNLFATQQSMVLLKNEGGTLPFKRGQHIAVVGPHANATQDMVGNYIGQICPGGMSDFSCITSPYLALSTANTGGVTTLAQGCAVNSQNTSGFAAAIAAAKAADVVVLALGINQSIEGEGHDRVNITLPGVQPSFADAIIALGKPTVVFLINGGIVAIDKLKNTAPAIIEAWYPGYQGGNALASVILGDYNPGGKLPTTIYAADYVNEVSMFSMVMEPQGSSPGRSYRYFTGTPLWHFGYGLSYTSFSVDFGGSAPAGPVPVSNSNLTAAASFVLKVTNTGPVAGDEVVQGYYTPNDSSNPLRRQVFAFQRVHLAAGESTTVTLSATPMAFVEVDAAGDTYSTPGTFDVLFTNGNDQPTATVSAQVQVTGTRRVVATFK